jgi:hypothetical protein
MDFFLQAAFADINIDKSVVCILLVELNRSAVAAL